MKIINVKKKDLEIFSKKALEYIKSIDENGSLTQSDSVENSFIFKSFKTWILMIVPNFHSDLLHYLMICHLKGHPIINIDLQKHSYVIPLEFYTFLYFVNECFTNEKILSKIGIYFKDDLSTLETNIYSNSLQNSMKQMIKSFDKFDCNLDLLEILSGTTLKKDNVLIELEKIYYECEKDFIKLNIVVDDINFFCKKN